MNGENSKQVAEGLQAMAAMMRHELNRFKMGDRARTMAKLILMLSWDEGLPHVRLPNHETFYKLTGIAVTHVSTILASLQRMRVIVVTESGGDTFYKINADANNWQVTSRADRTDVLRAWNEVRELNGLSRLTEAELNFKFSQIALFLSDKVTDLEDVNLRFDRPVHPFVQGATIRQSL